MLILALAEGRRPFQPFSVRVRVARATLSAINRDAPSQLEDLLGLLIAQDAAVFIFGWHTQMRSRLTDDGCRPRRGAEWSAWPVH